MWALVICVEFLLLPPPPQQQNPEWFDILTLAYAGYSEILAVKMSAFVAVVIFTYLFVYLCPLFRAFIIFCISLCYFFYFLALYQHQLR